MSFSDRSKEKNSLVATYRLSKTKVGTNAEDLLNAEWPQAQFDTKSRLTNERGPTSELHFTLGTPS